MFAGTDRCVEIEHEPRQSRRAGCSEVLNSCQTERSGGHTYRGGARSFGFGRRFLIGRTRCGICLTGVKRHEGMCREAEQSEQEREGQDAT